ncbi:ESCRT-II complex subunit-domain-containing protein [Polychytrium aggregatum]|uniref:ESCRT-II complex subunit-domain-containing protein n=1 Tax=Polychytrium aggregatum TaxID=110093 RepID=UPI0022FE085B|nr:ESCRT-II complex subunit-domain-containing protein [Polychytrium aggregatum]KAI9209812.1 ESCRT-II complex subunit-domain-containing protein [Polychytrium aggregatum]
MAAAFSFPEIHDFPPFYTRQPNLDTWGKQRQLWCDLVLLYFQSSKLAVLDITEFTSPRPGNAKAELFHNQRLKRSLKRETIIEIIDHLVESGNAEWDNPKKKERCIVFWRKPEEWASLIYKWAFETGQTNSVCTLYEILHGDHAAGQEFFGLDELIMRRSLEVLVKQGKAQLFTGSSDSDLGVKFF